MEDLVWAEAMSMKLLYISGLFLGAIAAQAGAVFLLPMSKGATALVPTLGLTISFLYLRDLAQPAPDRRRQSVNSGAFDGSLGPSLWDRDRNIGLRRSRVPRKNRRASCRLWPDCSGELRLRGPEVPYGRIVKVP